MCLRLLYTKTVATEMAKCYIGLCSAITAHKIHHQHHVFCTKAGLSLQPQESRLQFCPKTGLPPQTREPRLQFY